MSARRAGDSGGDGLSRVVRRTEGVQPWRRVFHMLCGVAMAVIVHIIGPGSLVPVAILAVALAAALGLDWIRLRSRAANKRFFRFFSALASPREARKVASSTWFLLGALTVLVVAPDSLFVPAMLVLAVADPAASVIGRLWGRNKVGKGSWEGTTAFFLVATAVLVPFAGLQAALIAAAATAALEVTPIGIDDNLTVPLAAALTLWLVGAG